MAVKHWWDDVSTEGLSFDGTYRSLVGQYTACGRRVSNGAAKALARRMRAQEAPPKPRKAQALPEVDGLTPWDDSWSRKQPSQSARTGWEDSAERYEQPIEELIEQRKRVYTRAQRAQQKPGAIHLSDPGPYAILHFGDPHVDDDGCNFDLLHSHIKLVQRTPHMYGGQLGDIVNGWVGRLERLYKHQTTTEDEAFRLAHWLMSSIPWLYFVHGNHDNWTQSGVMSWICRDAQIARKGSHEIDTEIKAGNSPYTFRLIARHFFKGHSQWNRTHAAMKSIRWKGGRHDLAIQGHTHTWALQSTEINGTPATAAVVRGYKMIDDYADAGGFEHCDRGQALVTVIDPRETDPLRAVSHFWDPEQGADYLNWLRSR